VGRCVVAKESRYAVVLEEGGDVQWFKRLADVDRVAGKLTKAHARELKALVARVKRAETRSRRQRRGVVLTLEDVAEDRKRLKQYAGERNPDSREFFREAHERGWIGSSYLFRDTRYRGGPPLLVSKPRQYPNLANIGWDNTIASAWVLGCTVLYDRINFDTNGRMCTLLAPKYLPPTEFATLLATDGFDFNDRASSAEHFD
jgi:hypothetical protein